MPPKAPAPSDLADKFMLRLPEGMRDRIAAAASQNNRSMNAEIISTLEQHYPSLASIDELISQTNELARIIRDTKERYDLMSLNSALRAIILELLKDAGKAGNPAYAPFAYAQPEEDDATD